MITAASPQVLFVAYGSPQQELWIDRNRERLGVPVSVGVGGALDFVAGVIPRAPAWMRNTGLEWLYRLAQQPRRWRRMLALPRFAWLILLSRRHPETATNGANTSTPGFPREVSPETPSRGAGDSGQQFRFEKDT